MPRTNRSRQDPARSAHLDSSDNGFIASLISDESNLCDAKVRLNGNVTVPVCLSFIVRWSNFFKEVYMVDGKGPFRLAQRVELPMSPAIFKLARWFFYSGHSPFITSVENLAVGSVEIDALQSTCRKLTELVHAAQFLKCSKLFQLSEQAMLKFVSKFPCMACTALETMNKGGHQIYNKDDHVFDSIRDFLLKTISENREEALLKTSPPDDGNSRNSRILALSAESLPSLEKVLAKDVEFSVEALFFWTTKGKALSNNTKQMLKNPGNVLRTRALASKALIKKLPLQDLDPQFVSSFIYDTGLLDKDSLIRLSHSALKRALDNAAELKEKLSTNKDRFDRLRSESRTRSS